MEDSGGVREVRASPDVMRGIVLGLLLAVALSAFGRLVWSRWRAYGDDAEMRGRVYWS